jgi:HK97 family phage major capsid protein
MNTIVKPLEIRALPVEQSESELNEARNNLLDELENLIAKYRSENRALSGRDENRYQSIKAEIGEIDKQLQAKKLNLDVFETRNYSPQEQTEIRQFVQYVKTGQFEGRDLSSGQSGSVIPKTIEKKIIAKIKEIAPIYERMTHFQVTGNLSIPSYGWDSHTVGWVEDFQTISSSGGTFLTVDLEAHALASLALIGNNLINRTDVPIVDIIVEQIATAIANFINNEIINGTTFSGNLKSVTQNVVSVSATETTIDELITIQMQVPSIYQDNSVWLMNPSTFLKIRKIKDADGMPLLVSNGNVGQDLGFNLLGKPVLLDENMSLQTTAQRSIYYGDLSGLVCNQNAPLRTQILLERYIDLNATGCITMMDLDISLAQPRALAVLIQA